MPGSRTRRNWHGSRSISSAHVAGGCDNAWACTIGHPTTAATAKTPRTEQGPDGLVMLESGRLVHVPVSQRRRPDDALCEQRKEDREAVQKLQDRLQAGSKHTFIHKLLRAYDANQRGGLTRAEMRGVLARLNMGFSEQDLEKVVTRLCPPGQNDLIPHNALVDMVSGFQVLGPRQLDNGQPTTNEHTHAAPYLKHTRRGVFTGAATKCSNPSTAAEAALGTRSTRDAQLQLDTSSASISACTDSPNLPTHTSCQVPNHAPAVRTGAQLANAASIVGGVEGVGGGEGMGGVGGVAGHGMQGGQLGLGRSHSMPPRRQQLRINNARTRAQWEPLLGCMHAWNWQVRPPGIEGVASQAAANTHEQRKQDALLISLLSQRFTQSTDQIRATFHKQDRARTGQLSKQQFVDALEAMHLQMPRPLLERLFELAHSNDSNNEQVNYTRFIEQFHTLGQKAQLSGGLQPTASTCISSPLDAAEVQQAVHSPLTSALRQRLRAKGSAAQRVFAQFNSSRNGQLSLAELTKGCQMLVQGVTERHVAALLAACDPTGSGQLSYRDFVSKLVDDDNFTSHNTAAMDNSNRACSPCVQEGHSILLMRPWTSQQTCRPTSVSFSNRPATSGSAFSTSPTGLQGTTDASVTQQRPHTVPHFSSNTAWTRDEQPAPGYTGTIPRHLRPQKPHVVAAVDKRAAMHQQGVCGLMESLLGSHLDEQPAMVADPHQQPCSDPQPASDSWSITPVPECAGHQAQALAPDVVSAAVTETVAGATEPTGPDGQGIALMPYDYEGAPPVPEGPHVRGKGLVPAARDMHAQTREEVSMDKRQRKSVQSRNLRSTRTLGVQPTSMRVMYASMPEFSTRQAHSSTSSARHYTLSSALQSARHDPARWPASFSPYSNAELCAVEGDDGCGDGDAPRGVGKARYALLSYPPTSHVTAVHPHSAQWADASETWVRKSDPSFLQFQQSDKQRAAQLQAVVCKIKAGNECDLELRKAAKEVQVATQDANRLAGKGMVAARYRERCAMAEVARTAHAEAAQPFFNRQLHFTDHVLIDPMWART